MSSDPTRTVVILAAGQGKRMKSALPKVLHPVLGRTLLGHVLAATTVVPAQRTVVVVGHGADQVRDHLTQVAPGAVPVLQEQQLGTGHAVRMALAALGEVTGTVLVLNGDVPLLTPSTLAGLVAAHESGRHAATLLVAEVADPTGLGRIVRGAAGGLEAIVEERDATPQQLLLREINVGVYAFEARALVAALGKLSTDNAQGEEYLTDVPGLLVGAGEPVGLHRTVDPVEGLGCNDRAELATLRGLLRDRVNTAWMRSGVTIIDPATTWIDVTATLAPDAVVHPNTQLHGQTRVGTAATIGPETTLIDTEVDEGATVVRAHAVSAQIGPGVSVGPFAYLRPGTRLGPRAKVGTFVETKNADLGAGAKVPHLSYVGDATIGEGTNIGAATVFVNYDGVNKHHTVIGEHARTGADNMFVAPVRVGDGAYTAAGSVITEDVPPGAMGIARGRQHNIEGWVQHRRPGTPAAEAAARAAAPGSTAATDDGDGPSMDAAPLG